MIFVIKNQSLKTPESVSGKIIQFFQNAKRPNKIFKEDVAKIKIKDDIFGVKKPNKEIIYKVFFDINFNLRIADHTADFYYAELSISSRELLILFNTSKLPITPAQVLFNFFKRHYLHIANQLNRRLASGDKFKPTLQDEEVTSNYSSSNFICTEDFISLQDLVRQKFVTYNEIKGFGIDPDDEFIMEHTSIN